MYQELLTRRNMLQASADSYREKEYTLQRQLNSADNKVRRLTSLSPDYASLLRERDTLSARLKSYNAKEQEALVNQQQAEATNENVKVISWPKFPQKGSNTRLIAAAGAMFAWGLTLFMLALLRVFLDPRLYAAPGPGRAAMRPSESGYIPEPVAQPMPAAAQLAPAAAVQPAAASYEPVAYEPAAYQQEPVYDAALQGQYDQQSYTAMDGQAGYAQAPHASSTMENYSQSPLYQNQAPQMQQPAQIQYDPNAYAQPGYEQSYTTAPQLDGSAALDVYSNPYLTGQTAGALDQHSQPIQAPYDPNAPQG